MKTNCSILPPLRQLALASAALLLTGTAQTRAALLLADDFNYTAGTTVGTSTSTGSMSGGTGFVVGQRWFDNSTGANLYTVTTGSLSQGSLSTSGNALSQGSDNIGAARNFNGTATTLADGTYYVSYLVSFSGNSPSTAAQYGGMQVGSTYFGLANLDGLTTTTREFVASNSFGGGVDGTTRVHTGVTMTPGTTYLLVGKISFSAASVDTSSLWINPLYSNEALAGTAQAVNTSTNSTSLAQVSFYTSGATFGMTVDEFRLGTSWADVTPGLPVPEPHTASVLVLAASALVLRRRRRPAPVLA